jgi:Zn-dependent protease with chaperone function
MKTVDFDFQRYVERRKGAREAQAREGAAYAYAGDLRVLRTLDQMRPVRLALEATVRMWKSVARAELLGTAVKVSPVQFPKIHALGVRCSEILHIAQPTIYIAPALGTLNAHTFGTDDDAYIVLHSALVDHLPELELMNVIGHECGHIQNNHVVFSTALYYLVNFANRFLKWVVTPAVMALSSWSRRAEITCDRAGLICTRNLDAAQAVLLKLALGSQTLYKDLNVEAFLSQMSEAEGGPAKYTELFRDHPYLPKRLAALRVFSESAYYRGVLGEEGGLPPTVCDAKVAELLAQ